MPTSTFFRLPEEKRQRLTDAAWREFTRVSCTGASINRIVQDACIPRGSFYQYFTDKEDLFAFLLRDLRSDFWTLLERALQAHDGDLSAALLAVFDGWFLRANTPDLPAFRRLLLLLKNPGLDWRQILFPRHMPQLPRRIRASLAPLPALEDEERFETAGVLAIMAFTGICKQCLFMPEAVLTCRQTLLQSFRLLFGAPPAAPAKQCEKFLL